VERNRNQLSLLYFDRYTLDLGTAKSGDDGPRSREAQERFLNELFWPGDSATDVRNANRFLAEGHQRLATPLLSIAYTLIALAALLVGEFNRRGQSRRVFLAVGVVVGVQIASLGLANLTSLAPMVAPLIYILPLTTIAAALWILVHPRAPAIISRVAPFALRT
jgi:lipopolysaccharide export system permease protein